MHRLVLAASAMILSLTAADNKLTPIQGTKYDHGLLAKSETGDSAITAREMLVDVAYTDGRPRKGAVAIFYDADSGFYMWEFGPVPMTEQTSTMTRGYGSTGFVYKAGDRLIVFGWYWNTLVIHESSTRAHGLDDAEAKALDEATGSLPKKLVHKTDDRVVIDTAKLFPRDFPLACPLCSGPAQMKVLDVTHKGNTWEVTLQGQWKQQITLDNKYQVTGTSRVD
jgi:hypothetical protein